MHHRYQRINSKSELATYDKIHEANRNKADEERPVATALREAYKDSPVDLWNVDLGDGQNESALFITGEEYINQRNNGINGRPIEDIDPMAIYNKQEELDNYGYTPYIPNDIEWQNFNASAGSMAISNFWEDVVPNLRKDNLDYTINKDGKSYSGNDIEKKFLDNIELINSNKEEYYSQEPVDENSIPMVGVHVLRDKNGNEIDRKREGQIINGAVVFDDGTKWTSDDGDIKWTTEEYDESIDTPDKIVEYYNSPKITLDDGQEITAYDLSNLYANRSDLADYGLFNMGKKDTNVFAEDGVHMEDFAPWLADTALTSVPYLHLATSVPLAIAGDNRLISGIDSKNHSDDNTYNLVDSEISPFDYATRIAATTAMPATERVVGGIGKGWLNKWVPETKYGAVNAAISGVGEGVEEVVTSPVEDMTRNGWFGTFANDVERDETDIFGNKTGQKEIVKDRETPLYERIGNFGKQMPENFVGGAALGTVYPLARRPISGAVNDIATLHEDITDWRSGDGRYKIVRPSEIQIDLDEEDIERMYGDRK